MNCSTRLRRGNVGKTKEGRRNFKFPSKRRFRTFWSLAQFLQSRLDSLAQKSLVLFMSEPVAKKQKLEESSEVSMSESKASALLNPKYLTSEHVDAIRAEHQAKKPFSYTVLPNFLDEKFLESCKTALSKEEWFPKNNDLYTFLQTDDLKISENVRRFSFQWMPTVATEAHKMMWKRCSDFSSDF